MKAVVLLSGGLDSSVLLADVATMIDPRGIHTLSIHYGQRHRIELDCAAEQSKYFRVGRHSTLDLCELGKLLRGCALTDAEVAIPVAESADQAVTVVPNRNAILLSIAFAAAVADGADAVYAGFQAGDRPTFPDCRPAFVEAFGAMQDVATEGYGRPALQVPFLLRTKAEIVRRGRDLGVDFRRTRSCYAEGTGHCGRCAPCAHRRAAFAAAGIDDPTAYEEAP